MNEFSFYLPDVFHKNCFLSIRSVQFPEHAFGRSFYTYGHYFMRHVGSVTTRRHPMYKFHFDNARAILNQELYNSSYLVME